MNENVVLVELIGNENEQEPTHSNYQSFSLNEGKKIRLSSSGIILNQENGIILISGNLFHSFLSKNNEISNEVKFRVHFDFEMEEEEKGGVDGEGGNSTGKTKSSPTPTPPIEGKLIKILYSNSVDKWITQICSGSSEWYW